MNRVALNYVQPPEGGTRVKITKDMPIAEVVETYPETIPVFQMHGLGCIGCAVAKLENIEQGATLHGLDIERLMKDLNAAIGEDGEK